MEVSKEEDIGDPQLMVSRLRIVHIYDGHETGALQPIKHPLAILNGHVALLPPGHMIACGSLNLQPQLICEHNGVCKSRTIFIVSTQANNSSKKQNGTTPTGEKGQCGYTTKSLYLKSERRKGDPWRRNGKQARSQRYRV